VFRGVRESVCESEYARFRERYFNFLRDRAQEDQRNPPPPFTKSVSGKKKREEKERKYENKT
jgi:hypothetical protein